MNINARNAFGVLVRIQAIGFSKEVLADYEGDTEKSVFSILIDTRQASTTRWQSRHSSGSCGRCAGLAHALLGQPLRP
ncbi:hypothetical protein [Streptomyces mirabilis]|uniref:hypothetical protein n=1 Tax=Streptomyces mirabilis TaxID=68239 RepID=UPI0033B7DB70